MLDSSVSRSRPVLNRTGAPEGRRVLDLAEGILVGLRRCSAEAAFHELLAVANRHGVPVSAAASALVEHATGAADAAATNSAGVAFACLEWGNLLPAVSGPGDRQS